MRLASLQKGAGGEPLAIAVLEKARDAGAHMLSGSVLDPSALHDLVPDWKERGAPLEAAVHDDQVYFLTPRGKIRFPFTPPPLQNHGNYVISLNKFVRWLARLTEEEGIDVFTGFSGSEVLYAGGRTLGVRTGDRGVGRNGERKGTFEPGVDIHAKVTIFADGVRGNLTKSLVRRLSLDQGRLPQVYAIGIKELWEAGPLACPIELLDGRIRQAIKCRAQERAELVRDGIPLEIVETGRALLATDEKAEFFKLAKLVLNLAERHPERSGDLGRVALIVVLEIHQNLVGGLASEQPDERCLRNRRCSHSLHDSLAVVWDELTTLLLVLHTYFLGRQT